MFRLKNFDTVSCLFVFNFAFKHMRSYREVPTCSSAILTNVLAHRNTTPQTQDMTPHPPRHSIQARGRPVDVLSIDVERHTGIHSYLL